MDPDPGVRARRFVAEFGMGELVYHRLCGERLPGLVTGVQFRPSGGVVFQVTWPSGCETSHYGLELTREYDPEGPGA